MDLGSDSNLQRETSLTVALAIEDCLQLWSNHRQALFRKKDAGTNFCRDKIFRWMFKQWVTIDSDIHNG